MPKAMGYPLKEALKAICGDNQWSYAVFWKLGCQNPKLLIWEDCYYGVMPCSVFPSDSKSRNESPTLEQLTSCRLSHETYAQPPFHVGEGVHFLVNKMMMMTNQVHMVGEGLVGRTAFTGNHEWIVSGSFSEMVHPPEVLSEVHLQFSAGMQTIAVIPVIPHGVLQLGSSWAMMENVGFIQDVKTLILQLVSLPSALLAGNEMRDGPVEEFRPPFNHTNTVSLDPYVNMKSFSSNVAFNGGSRVDLFEDSVFVDQASRSISRKNQDSLKPTSGELSDCLFPDGFPDKHRDRDLYEGLNIFVSKQKDQMPSANLIPCCNKTHYGSDVPSCTTSLSDIQPSVGEDLFDALGVNFQNIILNGYICKSSKYGPERVDQIEIKGKSTELTSSPHPDCDVMSESGMFSKFGSDHLLDAAVVSGVQPAATQSTRSNLSCRTTLTKGSISSGLGSISHPMDELVGHARPSMSSIDIGVALTSTFGKNDAANCAQTMSYSGSHVNSWVDQGPTAKNGNNVATANSKKFNVVGKQMRKRLKPGENPRPRPKDRQLIQDRLKELREMIPNGAKCSIDALLEQTIKHMLFLQNVSKHADKLKQTVKSKIIDEDGRMLLKDNFEGGATWAYEVDSQARMCPIIVEDLHPHHFLVEMLCEERGFFLEIADVIRGMGLSILKGVIQKRDDKIWAHFAVEANREITRMEIFLSLVHLLEHANKSSNISTIEGFKVYNTLIQPTFDPVTSVLGD